eukprot:GHVR01080336.1.p1 GENE.GHVR01080336.1~~GHVR01080336.1.p1  ORF type:complete len:138 (+),score=27.62 GHVR01080336.1:192-605(+)
MFQTHTHIYMHMYIDIYINQVTHTHINMRNGVKRQMCNIVSVSVFFIFEFIYSIYTHVCVCVGCLCVCVSGSDCSCESTRGQREVNRHEERGEEAGALSKVGQNAVLTLCCRVNPCLRYALATLSRTLRGELPLPLR